MRETGSPRFCLLFRQLFPFSIYIFSSRLAVTQVLSVLSQCLCFYLQLLLWLNKQDLYLNIKGLTKAQMFLPPSSERAFSLRSCVISGRKMQRVWKWTDCSRDATLDHSPKVSAGISLAALQNLQRLPSWLQNFWWMVQPWRLCSQPLPHPPRGSWDNWWAAPAPLNTGCPWLVRPLTLHRWLCGRCTAIIHPDEWAASLGWSALRRRIGLVASEEKSWGADCGVKGTFRSVEGTCVHSGTQWPAFRQTPAC